MKMRMRPLACAAALLAWTGGRQAMAAAAPPDDVVLDGGLVVDGTGAAAFRGDVAVRGGRISGVGSLPEARKAAAKRRIDARALVVSPGFVDLFCQA